MNTIQTTAIIRDRGQLTIPNKVRKILDWMSPNSVVYIKAETTHELVIKPYEQKPESQINWVEIWKRIKRSQSFKGKRGNLSAFIIKDRDSH